jgi:hypothetical protein
MYAVFKLKLINYFLHNSATKIAVAVIIIIIIIIIPPEFPENIPVRVGMAKKYLIKCSLVK